MLGGHTTSHALLALTTWTVCLPGESFHENSSSAQHIKLNQWKLPPKLDVQWPKDHKSLWELISNELADHVEEVGTPVLSALGANVLSTRRLAETSERHFDFGVPWPNGVSHVLAHLEDKMEDKLNKIEDKFDKVENKFEKMEEMMGRLLKKLDP